MDQRETWQTLIEEEPSGAFFHLFLLESLLVPGLPHRLAGDGIAEGADRLSGKGEIFSMTIGQ
jgi:hypothetical protein